MKPNKRAITVGNCTMFAETLPINILLDEVRTDDSRYILEVFKLFDIDGDFLVQIERHKVYGPMEEIRQCFTNERDALNYLEMYGVKREERSDRVDSEREYDPD